MAFEIKKAERKQIKIKIGVSSASGYGKTYSSLLIAKGICKGDLSKVCVIDTENGSANLYASLGDYSVIDLEAPFTPERYIEAIYAVEKAGFEVCVIDSITHSWDGTGGFLEIHDKATKAMRNPNSFMAWSSVTPRYKKFIDAILQCNIHVICCSRRKQEYEQIEIGGKKQVKKIGTREINREGFEYELSINFEIKDSEHFAIPSKDRTLLFPTNEAFVITENTGKLIRDWIDSGKEPTPKIIEESVNPGDIKPIPGVPENPIPHEKPALKKPGPKQIEQLKEKIYQNLFNANWMQLNIELRNKYQEIILITDEFWTEILEESYDKYNAYTASNVNAEAV